MKGIYFSYWLLGLMVALPSWAKTIPASASMEVEFELPQVEASIYARPYVAVWIEDKQRNPVRTIQLWVGDDEWLKDLRSWWRKVGRDDRTVVDAVTSATRPVGQYRFTWDGLDQQGKRVEQGDYTFYVEVVREHGGRNYIRQKITLGDESFDLQVAPTEETGQIVLHYQLN